MTADASHARVRQGTLGDNRACAAVLVAAINDLGPRNGSIDEASALAREVALVDGLDVEPLELDRDMAAVHAVDDAVLGHRREVDHRWFAAEREGHRYLRDGRVVGYGYVGLPDRGGNGPFAVLDASDLPAVMSHAERRRHELGADEASFEVALHNRIAIDHLLGRGYRMDTFMTLVCSSEPFGRFEQYLFCAPGLIL